LNASVADKLTKAGLASHRPIPFKVDVVSAGYLVLFYGFTSLGVNTMRRMSIAELWGILGMVAEGSWDAVNITIDAIGNVAVGHEYRGLFST
jgi:hypothetical protein